MVLDKYKNIIDEIVIYKNKEKDPEKKKSWEKIRYQSSWIRL